MGSLMAGPLTTGQEEGSAPLLSLTGRSSSWEGKRPVGGRRPLCPGAWRSGPECA